MKHIGIVECISSAQLYITDIKARGYLVYSEFVTTLGGKKVKQYNM